MQRAARYREFVRHLGGDELGMQFGVLIVVRRERAVALHEVVQRVEQSVGDGLLNRAVICGNGHRFSPVNGSGVWSFRLPRSIPDGPGRKRR
jgi:hypothetical protein